ncbi:MAG: hypothetical protein VX916_05170 [Planctomycetota bacterium]|nr:hypothetical protein [Planctomycetota bacterium]
MRLLSLLFAIALTGPAVAAQTGPPPLPWVDLGHALSGSTGDPLLRGTGTLDPDTMVRITLSNVVPHMPAWLLIGVSESYASYKSGVMVPSPDNFAFDFTRSGSTSVEGRWPVGIPSGFQACLQWWIADGAGPEGFAASNAVRLTAP